MSTNCIYHESMLVGDAWIMYGFDESGSLEIIQTLTHLRWFENRLHPEHFMVFVMVDHDQI